MPPQSGRRRYKAIASPGQAVRHHAGPWHGTGVVLVANNAQKQKLQPWWCMQGGAYKAAGTSTIACSNARTNARVADARQGENAVVREVKLSAQNFGRQVELEGRKELVPFRRACAECAARFAAGAGGSGVCGCACAGGTKTDSVWVRPPPAATSRTRKRDGERGRERGRRGGSKGEREDERASRIHKGTSIHVTTSLKRKAHTRISRKCRG